MRFGTIASDIPWPTYKLVGRGTARYPRLTDRECLDLPIPDLAEKSAHLYTWIIDVQFVLAADCFRHWGFKVVATIPWVKVSQARALRIGPGNYLRKAHEICVFATRGKPHCVTPALRPPSVLFFAPRAEHSEKPPELYRWAERISPERRLEMFARAPRRGWSAWPNAGEDATSANACTIRGAA